MELLIAMFCGAVGAVAVRMMMRVATPGVWIATVLGIIGGAGAWQVLALIGPGVKAGPLAMWHLVGGLIGGGVLMALAAILRARLRR